MSDKFLPLPLTVETFANSLSDYKLYTVTSFVSSGVRTADTRKEMLEITFADGSSSFFPYCWLRDNCQCSQCFDSDALCRKLTLEDWQHNDCPRSVQVRFS